MPGDECVRIDQVSGDQVAALVPQLGALLRACVHAGANVGFILPFGQSDAEAFWRAQVLPAVAGGKRVMLVAHVDGALAGTVQLETGLPANQPHRAEVTKLLVHPDFRRKGLARALMGQLEACAREHTRSLITLDTRTGDMAEPLYASLGYETVGQIPDFCRDPVDGQLHPTTIMFKRI